MTTKPVNPFRQRLLKDMAVRPFGEKSQQDYLRHIDNFLAFLGRPAERATENQIGIYSSIGQG